MMDRVLGVQSHNKTELEKYLRGKKKSIRNKYKVASVKKPKWWTGKWHKTYEIVKK